MITDRFMHTVLVCCAMGVPPEAAPIILMFLFCRKNKGKLINIYL